MVGLADGRFGERVASVVRLRDGSPELALDTLVAHRCDHIADYKVPRTLLLVNEIPLTAAGKPDTKAAEALCSTRVSCTRQAQRQQQGAQVGVATRTALPANRWRFDRPTGAKDGWDGTGGKLSCARGSQRALPTRNHCLPSR